MFLDFLQYWINSPIMILSVIILLLMVMVLFMLAIGTHYTNCFFLEKRKLILIIKFLLFFSFPFLITLIITFKEYYYEDITLYEQKQVKLLIETSLNLNKQDNFDNSFDKNNLKKQIEIIKNLSEDLKTKYYNYFRKIMEDEKITYGEYFNFKYQMLEKLNEEQFKLNEINNKEKIEKEQKIILQELNEMKNNNLLKKEKE